MVPQVAQLKIAVCRTPYSDHAAPEAVAALDRAVETLVKAGARVVPLELPLEFDHLNDAKEAIMRGEGRAAFLPHARAYGEALHDGLRGHAENRAGITSARLKAALDYAAHCRLAFEAHYRGFDAVLTFSASGEADEGIGYTGDPMLQSLWTVLHVPVVAIPTQDGPSGLPLGVKLVGFRFADAELLAVAQAVSRVIDPWFGQLRIPG